MPAADYFHAGCAPTLQRLHCRFVTEAGSRSVRAGGLDVLAATTGIKPVTGGGLASVVEAAEGLCRWVTGLEEVRFGRMNSTLRPSGRRARRLAHRRQPRGLPGGFMPDGLRRRGGRSRH
jgi:hypothetical protein